MTRQQSECNDYLYFKLNLKKSSLVFKYIFQVKDASANVPEDLDVKVQAHLKKLIEITKRLQVNICIVYKYIYKYIHKYMCIVYKYIYKYIYKYMCIVYKYIYKYIHKYMCIVYKYMHMYGLRFESFLLSRLRFKAYLSSRLRFQYCLISRLRVESLVLSPGRLQVEVWFCCHYLHVVVESCLAYRFRFHFSRISRLKLKPLVLSLGSGFYLVLLRFNSCLISRSRL